MSREYDAFVVSSNVVVKRCYDSETGSTTSLTIIQESSVDEGAFSPAVDIIVWGEDAIRQLREICNIALGAITLEKGCGRQLYKSLKARSQA